MYTATTTRASLFHESPSLARSFRAAYLEMRPRQVALPPVPPMRQGLDPNHQIRSLG
jgi:hypothetical protein